MFAVDSSETTKDMTTDETVAYANEKLAERICIDPTKDMTTDEIIDTVKKQAIQSFTERTKKAEQNFDDVLKANDLKQSGKDLFESFTQLQKLLYPTIDEQQDSSKKILAEVTKIVLRCSENINTMVKKIRQELNDTIFLSEDNVETKLEKYGDFILELHAGKSVIKMDEDIHTDIANLTGYIENKPGMSRTMAMTIVNMFEKMMEPVNTINNIFDESIAIYKEDIPDNDKLRRIKMAFM